MAALKVGGQCEGYGGIFLALQHLLDVEHAWYAEIDPNASKILAHHYPGVPNHGDITSYNWSQAAPVDVFTSGFPCTDISPAGKREGSAGKNFLWPSGVVPAVEALRPPLAVFENVPNLLRIEDGAVFALILADLDRLGYHVSWATVGACKVGACHHRHRVFVAATLVDTPFPMSDPVAHRAGGGWAAAQMLLFGEPGPVRWPAAGHMSAGTVWEMPVDICGVDEQILPTPKASDTGTPGRRAGEGFRPPLSEVLLNLFPTPTATPYGNNQSSSAGAAVRPSLDAIAVMLPTPRATDGTKGGPNQRGSSGDVMLPAAVQPQRFGKYAAAVARHEQAFGLSAPDPTEPGRNGKPRLSPQFPEWMQGLPRGHLTDVVERSAALKAAGNGVNWLQCAYALPLLPAFRAAVDALTADRLAVAA
jgi:DNA (cytosine-5)-methyltransferase 1